MKLSVEWSKRYSDYTEDVVSEVVPDSAGIYIIYVRLEDASWRRIYVGQSDDLKRRLKEHLSDNEPNKELKEHLAKYVCGFRYAIVKFQSNRDGIESYLISKFNPECNDQTPRYSPIEVNLPQ